MPPGEVPEVRSPLLWLCLLVSLYLVTPACAAGLQGLSPLTTDGKSSLNGAGMVARTGKIACYRATADGVRQLVVLNPDGSGTTLVEVRGWPDNAAWSPDGSRLAYTWKATPNNAATVKVWQVGQDRATTLFAGTPAFRLLIWSPNGRYLAAEKHRPESKQVTLSVFDTTTGQETELCPSHFNAGGAHETFAWAPDSKQLCFPSQATPEEPMALWLCNVDGAGLKRLTPPDCKVKPHSSWSPDGKWLLFQAGYLRSDDNDKFTDAWLIRPDGSELKPLTQGSAVDWSKRYSYIALRWTANGKYALVREFIPDPARKAGAPVWSFVDVSTKEVIRAMGPDLSSNRRTEGGAHWAFSPNGNRFFCQWIENEYTGLGTDQETKGKAFSVGGIFDLPSRTYIELFRSDADQAKIVGSPAFSPDGNRVYLTVQHPLLNQPGQFQSDIYYIDAGKWLSTGYRITAPPAGPTFTPSSVTMPF